MEGGRGALPAPAAGDTEGEVLESVRKDVAGSDGDRPGPGGGADGALDGTEVEAGARLLWAGLYLQDMRILEVRLRAALTGSPLVGQDGGTAHGA